MKYCIDFYGKQTDLLNLVDEINIDLLKIKDLGDLEEFCEQHKNQRINLCINDWEDAINEGIFIYIFNFQKEHQQYDISIRIPGWDNEICKKMLDEYPNAKFFFRNHVIDWDTLLFYLSKGVSDVYIAEAMGFELAAIAEIVKPYGAKIRVYPNVAQASRRETKGLMKFWIRPEDIEIYEKYIDVCEFFYDEYEKQEIYYKIYKDDKKWLGDLSELIIGLESGFDSTCIVPRFAHKRTKCGRACMKGDKCKMCHRVIELAKTLKKTPMRVTIDTEREDLNGERSNSESGNSSKDIK